MHIKNFKTLRINLLNCFFDIGLLDSEKVKEYSKRKTFKKDFHLPFFILDKDFDFFENNFKIDGLSSSNKKISEIFKSKDSTKITMKKIKEFYYVFLIIRKFPIIEFKKDFEKLKKENGIFRGENDIVFPLVPSLFRKNEWIDKNHPDINLIKLNEISEYYNYFNLVDVYKDIFMANKNRNANPLKLIHFYELMQHSECKSNMLDFTTSLKVALTFGIHKCKNKEITIYCLKGIKTYSCRGNKFKKLIENFEIKKYDSYNILMNHPKSIKGIMDTLKPELFLFEKTSNDRMITQKGVMIFVSKGVLINGRFMFSLLSPENFQIYHLDTVEVKKYIEENKNNSYEFNYKKLMKPYTIFKEKIKKYKAR